MKIIFSAIFGKDSTSGIFISSWYSNAGKFPINVVILNNFLVSSSLWDFDLEYWMKDFLFYSWIMKLIVPNWQYSPKGHNSRNRGSSVAHHSVFGLGLLFTPRSTNSMSSKAD